MNGFGLVPEDFGFRRVLRRDEKKSIFAGTSVFRRIKNHRREIVFIVLNNPVIHQKVLPIRDVIM